MRDIKFRAWLIEPKIMIDVLNLNIEDEYVGAHDIYEPNYYERYNFKDLILMQYTGLKDMNEEDIYEGDIISDSSNELTVVKWGQEQWGWFLASPDRIRPFNSTVLGWARKYQIIGNIYKNIELFEVNN